MIKCKKVGGESLQRESIKGGIARLSTQINQMLRSHMGGKESVNAETPAQADRFIRAVAKRVKELSAKQRKSD